MTAPTNLLSFAQGSDEWHALRKRALADLFWFDAFVLGYADRFPLEEDTHRLPLAFASRKTGVPAIDEAPMQLFLWPRMTGKSTCITRGYTIQEICRDPNISILIANERAEVAAGFLSEIKQQFEQNDLLRHLFPEVIPEDFKKTTWAAEKMTVRRTTSRAEATVEIIGVGGTVTGRHYDRCVCDDLISQEAAENARAGSWIVMDRVNRWVTRLRALLSTYKPFPFIIFIGTHWFHDDTYYRIEELFGHGEEPTRYLLRTTLSDGRKVSREVYRKGDLAVMKMKGLENGQAVFPKIWSLDALAKLRQENPEDFACQIQNEPSDEAVVTFSQRWLRYWQLADANVAVYERDEGGKRFVHLKDLVKMMVVDPAFTASGEGARAALVVVGTDTETHKHLVLEAYATRSEPRDFVLDILNKAKQWGVTRVYIESVAQQKGFIQFVEQEARRRAQLVNIEEVKPGGRKKDVRIEGLSVYFKSGQILVNASQLDLLEEYRKYRPGARLVDLLDALAYCPETWPRAAGSGTGDARQRSQAQLQTYLSRRGLR